MDRIGNVLKHVLLLSEDKDKNAERSLPAEAEATASHKEEEDGDLIKAFMMTDTSVPDVPITETSPGFQVCHAILHFQVTYCLCCHSLCHSCPSSSAVNASTTTLLQMVSTAQVSVPGLQHKSHV